MAMRQRARGLGAAAAAVALIACDPHGPAPAAQPETVDGARLVTVADGLDHPWSIAFLPNGDMLVTERAGRLRVIRDGALVSEPVAGVPAVHTGRQAGLFDVVPHPDFVDNGLVYLSYAAGDASANQTRLARARFDGAALRDLEVIFAAEPLKATDAHFGGRIAFLSDGTLLLTVGEGFDYREQAQNLSNDLGTIVRLNDDGSVPADNPFVGVDGARPEIWSYGHRNPQGLVIDPVSGTVWEHEYGPKGGDELNRIERGANYGWPLATFGVDYSGAYITPLTEIEGAASPIVHWTPSISPSGMTLYDGDLFPQWKGDLFLGTLTSREVRRIDLEGGEVVGQEALFEGLAARIRDVATGPDGALYILTDHDPGRVIRVEPAR